MSRTVTVEIDSELHGGKEPKDEVQRLTWEILDTAWNLLREGAVRVTIAELKAQFTEQGVEFNDADEIFAKNADSDDPGDAKSYMDLALQKGDGMATELAEMGLASAFEVLAQQTFVDAAHAMGFSVGEETGE